jgi:hypothetical protein
MKLYNALIKKNAEGKIEDIKLLEDGFSWMAFFFSIFWFLYHKMWKESFAFFVVSISFSIFDAAGIISGFSKILVELLLIFMVALNANYWLLESLRKKNYEFVGLVFGSDSANAKMRFVNNLEYEDGLNSYQFADAIINPKLHHNLAKLKKSEPYFVI